MKFIFYLLSIIFVNNTFSLIHIIGDSHVAFCFLHHEGARLIESNKKIINRKDFSGVYFKLNWVGPRLLYRVQDVLESLIEEDQFTKDLSDQDILIFSFGEIDCRLHIGKQAQLQNVSIETIIDDLVLRYEAALRMVEQKFISLQLRMVVMGIIPPYKEYGKELRIGTLQQHIDVVSLLNSKLEKMALKNNYTFLDIFNLYAKEDGVINHQEIDGWTHVSKTSNFKIWSLLLNEMKLNHSYEMG